MIDFKKYLRQITILFYIMAVLGIPSISIFLFGDSLRNYFSSDAFNILSTISSINSFIFSIFLFFIVYLAIFHNIILKDGEATVVKKKNTEYFRTIIIFLIIAVMLFSASVKDVIAVLSKLF